MKKVWTIAIAGMLVLTACGQKDNNGTNGTNAGGAAGGTETEQKTLVLGTSADYAPYEFHKKIDGKDTIVGFDIEIAKEIAKDQGAKLEITDMEFDSLLMALNTGKVDFVISGMTPDAERSKAVDFSQIYYMAEQAVLVKKGDEAKYNKLDDLKGKKIGIQKGSIQEKMAKDVEGAKLTALAKIPELMLVLDSGRVDALIVEKPVAEQYLKTQEGLALANAKIEQPADEGGSAIAVKKGNKELQDAINKTIDRITESGDLDRFVVEANELAGNE